jgi:hypothetical protein
MERTIVNISTSTKKNRDGARVTRIQKSCYQKNFVAGIRFDSDPERLHGTCYRAANWKVLGRTTGRGKDDQTKKANRSLKDVLGYPLTRNFRQLLGEVK